MGSTGKRVKKKIIYYILHQQDNINLILRTNEKKKKASEYPHLEHKFGILSEHEVGGSGPSVFIFSCALLYIPTVTAFSSTH